MIQQIFNWRTGLAVVAILIVIGTVFYSNHLAKRIAVQERQKISEFAEALESINNPDNMDTKLGTSILSAETDIPILAVNEKDSIFDHRNLDSARILNNESYRKRILAELKSAHQPIEWRNPLDATQVNRLYYGDSPLLKQVRYYPIVQLIIVALFIFITLYAITTRNKSTQNQVWAGMAKETAHQLGTPISSLQGWVEMLKEGESGDKIAPEIEKDVARLKLVSDRFGKIGSSPKLEEKNIVEQIQNMMDYMRKRATGKVAFSFDTRGEENVPAMISGPLFDWVIENLLKNALDSMEGKGSIAINLQNTATAIYIDVTDSGKGISKANIVKVFKPGFTTKKRGWGLGLSLSKRIIEQYHRGDLFVKQSELNKGTTFRIVLRK
jgi:signal transduction histidine kinase